MTPARKQRPPSPAPQPNEPPRPPLPRAEKQSRSVKSPDKKSTMTAAERYELKKQVRAMVDDGCSQAEIAVVLGIKQQAVSSMMIRANLANGRRGATRCLKLWIADRYYRNLEAAIAEHRKSPSAGAAHLLQGLLVDETTAKRNMRRK